MADRQTAPPQPAAAPGGGETAALDEREMRLHADYEWGLHDAEVRRAHAGQVVAVCDRRVWGAARNHAAALADALRQAGCPARERLALVVVPEA
jgi:hypothetical protein